MPQRPSKRRGEGCANGDEVVRHRPEIGPRIQSIVNREDVRAHAKMSMIERLSRSHSIQQVSSAHASWALATMPKMLAAMLTHVMAM